MVENRDFFIPSALTPPVKGGGVLSEYRHNVWYGKLHVEWCVHPKVKKVDDTLSRLDTIPACDRRMDRRKDISMQHITGR